MTVKSSLKDKLEDDELDLSMMQLSEVPVRDIELLGQKVMTVNLSHNLLTSLPPNFPLLSHITKLDLSKNGLTELPENFGSFKALKSLDLYANRLEKLPVSFAQLKHLKWLDLKDNPLCPALKQAAGDCITPNDCALCAKKVVALLQSMESQLQRERQRRMEEEMRGKKEQERREEAEREKVRQDKRAAEEKRREEARMREVNEKRGDVEAKTRHEGMNGNGVGKGKAELNGNGHGLGKGDSESYESSSSLLSSLLLFMCGLAVVGAGLAVSLLWVYTEGRLDSKSIATALPVLQADVEEWFGGAGQGVVKAYSKLEDGARPYVEKAVVGGKKLWAEGGSKVREGARWLEREHGDTLKSLGDTLRTSFLTLWAMIKGLLLVLWAALLQIFKALEPQLSAAWEASKPFFHQLGKIIIDYSLAVFRWLQENFPGYVLWAQDTGAALAQGAVATFQKISEAF